MKIMKKIGALVCAAAISVSMVSAIPVSAKVYCGGENLDRKWLLQDGYGATVRYVKDVRSGGNNYGSIFASYTRGAGVRSHTKANDTGLRYHYSRVVSGGRWSEGDACNSYWMSTSGIIDLKNNMARFEGYYIY